jgi:hypothetical protein
VHDVLIAILLSGAYVMTLAVVATLVKASSRSLAFIVTLVAFWVVATSGVIVGLVSAPGTPGPGEVLTSLVAGNLLAAMGGALLLAAAEARKRLAATLGRWSARR